MNFISKHSSYKRLLFILCFINSISFSQVFQKVPDIDFYSGYLGFASWCDFNSDGYLDVFVSGKDFGANYQHTIFYINNGDKSFTESDISYMPKVIYGDVSWGDFDNNGTLDLIYAGTTSGFCEENITKIYKNVNDTGFIELDHNLPYIRSCCIKWVDIDNDGLLDIYYHGIDSNNEFDMGVFKNSGSDVFVEIETNLEEIFGPRGNGTVNSAEWADFNNDGLKDAIIAMSTHDDFKIVFYKNLGNLNFQKLDIGVPDLNYVNFGIGDINQDGLLDIAISGSTKEYLSSGDVTADIYFFVNMGNMNFNECFKINNIGVFSNKLEFGDFDNDGFLDLLYYGAGGSTRKFKLFTNNHDLTFSVISHSFLDAGFGGASFGDFDNDNDLDILYYGRIYHPYDMEINYIYENISETDNEKPLSPDNFSIFAIDNDLTINWNSGSDDATLPASLYYNLCIGTPSNPNSLLSSYSLNGKLKTINLGNLNQNHSYLYENFPEGSYTIKLQSIDNSYNASGFSTIDFCFEETSHIFNDTLFFCEYDSVLIVVEGDYQSYLWNTGSHDPYIYASSQGLYNVNLTNIDGCLSSETVYVKMMSGPDLYLGDDITISKAENINLSSDIEYTIYLWSNSSEKESITVYGREHEPGEHFYWLKVTDEFGCTALDSIKVTVVDAYYNDTNWDVNIYPVPYWNQFTIASNCIVLGNTEIQIYDINGKVIYYNSLAQLDYYFTIDLSQIANGTYVLLIRNDFHDVTKSFKLVKHYPREF